MNELARTGPINLDNSEFLPKQDIEKLEAELEAIRIAHQPKADPKPTLKIQSNPVQTYKPPEESKTATIQQSPPKTTKIDPSKLSKIQYIGKLPMKPYSSSYVKSKPT